MLAFRILLAVSFTAIVGYTVLVVAADGVNFVVPFLADLFAIGWAGQFNLDFSIFLVLAAVWIVWRSDATPQSYLLALCMFGGAIFFCAYLFYLTLRAENKYVLLLGERRAAGLSSG